MTRPSLPMRALATALCLALTLPAQATRFGAVWPEPQPERVAPTKPNFRAPSSMSCERPVEARIVGGRPVQDQARGDARDREADKREMATRSKIKAEVDIAGARAKAAPFIPMPEVAMAAPMPAPASIQRAPSVPAPINQQAAPPVTAGMVDDNADFNEYLAFRARTQVQHRERDVRERYLLEVKDASGHGVADAEVAVRGASNGAAMWARTDTAGRVWLHPNAFDPGHASSYEVTARKNGRQNTTTLTRGQKSAVELRLDDASQNTARLDLVFLVDATGSMGDEIEKLRGSLQTIVKQISKLPSHPDLCLGLVAYRDKVDEFLIKSHDLSNDVQGFQGALNRLQADGGGDYPEAMNEAFDDTVQNISWRGDGATRLVVLLADAPPHLDYNGPQYDNTMMAALGKGIKVFSVGASGLDKQGEYIQRQIAQYTGGRFVFLTYENANRPGEAPGRETSHDVHNYSVETLDRLIVRLVSQELAALN